MRRRTLLAATAMLSVALGALLLSGGTEPGRAQEEDPLAVVEAFGAAITHAFTTGDGSAVADHFTEDGYLSFYGGGTFGGSLTFVGHQALTVAFTGTVDPEYELTAIDTSVDGNTVTVTTETRGSETIAAGIERTVEHGTAVVEGGLLASFVIEVDVSDAQTAELVAWQEENVAFDDAAPPGSTTIAMAGDQPGDVTVGDFGGAPFVALVIDLGEAGVRQPAHVHTGTCAEPGPIVYPLSNVNGGVSVTVLSTSIDELLGTDYIVNVHLSAEESTTYVSCAVLEAPEEPVVLPTTGTGGSTGMGLSWLIASLALVGVAFAGAGTLAARRRS